MELPYFSISSWRHVWAQVRGQSSLFMCTRRGGGTSLGVLNIIIRDSKIPPPLPKRTSGTLLSLRSVQTLRCLHTCTRRRGTAVSARKCDESGKKRLASGAPACGAEPERAAAPPRNQHRKVRPCNIHGSGVASRTRRPPRAHTRVISSFSHFGCAMRRRGGRAAAKLAPSTERKP